MYKRQAYIQNSKVDKNRTLIENLTEEWKEYQYTLKIDSTGYLAVSYTHLRNKWQGNTSYFRL